MRRAALRLRLLLAMTVCAAALLGSGALPASATTVMARATGHLDLRASGSGSARLVGTLERGQRISVVGKTVGGWAPVRFHRQTAYVRSAALYRPATGGPAAPQTITTTGTKVTTTRVNVRSGAAVTRSLVGRLPEGSTVTLTGKLSHGYAQTRYAGSLRWVYIAYLGSLAVTAPAVGTPGRPVAPPVVPPVVAGHRGAAALAFAQTQLGKPYVYGAVGPSAYDCSGLVLAAWRKAGVTLPRTSQQQFTFGTKVAKADLRPGDLVFFYGPSPSHVALYVGNGQIIHSPRPGKTVEYSNIAYMPYAGARRPG